MLTLLASVVSACNAAADWQRLHSEAPAFSVEAPEGWELRAVEGRGARLLSPDDGAVVEVVLWEALRPPATAESALAEHEAVLARALDYRRDSVEELIIDEERHGLLATGRVRSRGLTEGSVFYAFGVDTMHVVVGTFARPERIDQMREDLLDRIVRSFRLNEQIDLPVAPDPTPPVDPDLEERPQPPPYFEPTGPPEHERTEDDPDPEPEPPAPEKMESERAPMTIGVGPETEPISPGEGPAAEMPWIEHRSAYGFSLTIPVDRQVGIESGIIVINPAVPEDEEETLLIAPIFGTDPGAEEALSEVLGALPGLRLTRTGSVEADNGVTIVDGDATGRLRLRATWSHDNERGLLIAAIAPHATWDRSFPRMARIASGFEPGAWGRPRGLEQVAEFDAGGLTVRLPEGWEVSGGLGDDTSDPVIDLDAGEMDESGINLAWKQPLRPLLRDLSPLLESLGWREGERHSASDGGGLLIYRRRDPVEMIEDIYLRQHLPQVADVEIEGLPPRRSASSLLGGDQATGQVVRVEAETAAGRRELLFVAATARAEPPLTATCWEAAVLMADAPEGRLAEATRTLAEMVRSARLGEDLAEHLRESAEDLISRADKAVQAIASEYIAEVDTDAVSALTVEDPDEDELWEVPRGILDYWFRQASTRNGGRPPEPGDPQIDAGQ